MLWRMISIHSLWNYCRSLNNSGFESYGKSSLMKNYIFSSTQRLFLHCWQMTTNLASLLWMVTEHFLAHCKATRERFYTNSLLICRRNTVRKYSFCSFHFYYCLTHWYKSVRMILLFTLISWYFGFLYAPSGAYSWWKCLLHYSS